MALDFILIEFGLNVSTLDEQLSQKKNEIRANVYIVIQPNFRETIVT